MIHVVEFQKRGLPHAHFLVILKGECKLKCPEQFDRFVCAEIPDGSNAYLRSLVLRHMMHGPCGAQFPSCPCMKQRGDVKECRYRFPKKFSAFTTSNADGYPVYARRDTGEVVRVRGLDMDNRWVIPYNPFLLATFDCHMNVEVCSTITAVKYLYKYVYKGHDRISFALGRAGTPEDEIESFQSGRWVTPPEAAWRIFRFDMYDMLPSVTPLQVHLPNNQTISFRESESVGNIVADVSRNRTTLTAFFEMNKSMADGTKYLYSEFPEYFVWDRNRKSWRARKSHTSIGRLVFVNPIEGDRYYLRLLLCHIKGPTSYEDLLTVDGVTCPTFQQAAIRRGLVEPDDSVAESLREAAEFQMPYALRRLFATQLIFAQPSDPQALWNKFYKYLSEDFERRFPLDSEKVLQMTCADTEHLLRTMGKSFVDFGMPHLHNMDATANLESKDVIDAINAPVPSEYHGMWNKLNHQQLSAYKSIMECVESKRGGVFFIDGPGGTGKTFLYQALYAKLRLQGKIVLPTATSGIAASNIPSGRTAHSRFKIPLDVGSSLTCSVPKQGDLAKLFRRATLIIWDEASMARRENIEMVDLLLRDICSCDEPFGGKIFVFGGDFRQVLPVIPKRAQPEIVDASLVSSHLWPHFKRFTLSENMRAREDPSFSELLLSLGDGRMQQEETSKIELPPQMIYHLGVTGEEIDELVDVVYPDLDTLAKHPAAFSDKAILTPTNDEVDAINAALIQKFPGSATTYKSFDRAIDDHCNMHPTEFLNTLCPGGMSPHELSLKVNCPVILLRNLNPSIGLCNGTRLICKVFMANVIVCEIANGFRAGESVFIPRINLRPSTSVTYPFKFERVQFPIKLCFAMTINKSQGQTLGQVGIYLRRQCFSHGQLYVALSRGKKASQVKVFLPPIGIQLTNSHVTNVVSYEILRRAGIIG